MLRSSKKQFVEDLEQVYKNSNSVIVTHYHGLTVADVTKLRSELRGINVSFRVVKNTLSRIAASRVGLPIDADTFSGPTAIAYSEDPVAAAKGVVEFAKENENLKIISGVVNDVLVDETAIHKLAKLPSLDTLRGQLVGLLQAPAANIARTINAPAGALARVIKAYSEKK